MVRYAFKQDLVIVIMDDHGVLEANEAVVFEVRTHCRGVTQILNPIFLGIEWIVVLVGIFVLGG